MLLLEDTVLVFDLDDTLYQEVDYQRSGIRYLGALTSDLAGISIADELWDFYIQDPKADHLGYICKLTGWPSSFKDSLLWAYRLHRPDISLDNDTEQLIESMRIRCHALAILTDGRVASQMAKIKALGLDWMPVFISEAWNSPKPEPARFIEIQKKWPNKALVYVADNPERDFLAPNGLGWTTVGLRGSGQNIHSQTLTDRIDREIYMPQHWVNDLSEIPQLIGR